MNAGSAAKSFQSFRPLDLSISPIAGTKEESAEPGKTDMQLKMLSDALRQNGKETKCDDKLLVESSEIKVDEQDLTPVEVSENLLCSQDLAQFVMTQAFPNKDPKSNLDP